MIRPIPLKLPAVEVLREAISNIERGGGRPSASEDVMIDALAEGVTVVLHRRLSPLERRLARTEAALRAMGVRLEDE